MLDELTLWPRARSAVASLSWLLETHRNGRIGSPIVAGSSNRCKSSNSVGSLTVNRGVPPPLAPHLSRQGAGVPQVLQTAPNRAPGDLRRARDRRNPAVARRLRLRRRAQPPASLVQRRPKRVKPDAQG